MAKKKKKKLTGTLTFILLLLAGLATGTWYITRLINRPKFVQYPAFGIDIPVNYTIHGIDVSRHQAVIDWADVKAMQIQNVKIGFGFMKATEGIQSVDGRFRKNWFDAKKAGIPRGAYHFFNAGKSGKAQAENFIETVNLEKGDLPPVLDVEQIRGTSVANLQQRVGDWIKVVEKHYGVKPIIYTNADFYKNYLAGKFDDYPLWVAHYLVKDKPRIKRNWIFWQHNETGRVNGINAFVDFNVFNGDSTDFSNLLIQ
ncbi:MAG: glycoside hydrolase family 25 protein [Ferruginibacter sp.]|nr:glycoside hydrolase family 25 protein [Ferruginibacter sp.]